MAKLNGVTTVSERIQYNGAEYVKSDEAAAVGDIARYDGDNYSFLPSGEFYVVSVDSDEDLVIYDEDGDPMIVGEEYTVFKRVEVAAQPPQYREVKRKANVGERIRIVNASFTVGSYKNGDELTVKSAVRDTRLADHIRAEEVSIAILDTEYVVLEPTAKVAKPADPAPKPGDKVRSHRFPDTLHTLVKRLPKHDGGGYGKAWDITPGTWLGEKQFYIVERVVDENVEEPRLKVGEYAKVIGGNDYQTEIGDIVVIHAMYGDDYRVTDLSGKQLGGHKKSHNVIRATDAEVAEAKRKNVKVGDYVRITKDQYAAPVGTIVRVGSVRDDSTISYAWDGSGGWVSDYYELLTPTEAEQARKEAEEEAKWSAIGRKVNEFKAGDIVRVKCDRKYAGVKVGDVETIKDLNGSGVRLTKINPQGINAWMFENEVELIAPVESLFNR